MSLVLIINLRLHRLDKLLKFGNLEFKKLNCVLSGDLLSLKGSRELERRLELAGEGFEAMDDILWDVGPLFRPLMIVFFKLCQRRFWGSWSTDLAARPVAVLVFCSGFIVLIYPLQFMRDNGGNASGVVVVSRKLLVMVLFSGLSLSFTFFHKLLDQFNIMLEAIVLGDERIEEMELVCMAGEGALGLP